MSTKGLNDFVWYDLQTPDVDAAIKFYSALFGWKAKGEEMKFWSNQGDEFGGVQEPQQPGIPAHWMGYIETDALDTVLTRSKKMGANLLAGPININNDSRIAVMTDPQGAAVALYEGGKSHESWEPHKDRAGDFGWSELGTTDIEGALGFYGENFGWKRGDTMDMENGAYHMAMLGERPVAGLYDKPAEMPMSAWSYYINVDDVQATVDKTKELGGNVVYGPQTVPGMVTFAILTDPQGAVFGVAKSDNG